VCRPNRTVAPTSTRALVDVEPKVIVLPTRCMVASQVAVTTRSAGTVTTRRQPMTGVPVVLVVAKYPTIPPSQRVLVRERPVRARGGDAGGGGRGGSRLLAAGCPSSGRPRPPGVAAGPPSLVSDAAGLIIGR